MKNCTIQITTSLTPSQVYNENGSLMGSKWQNCETEASAWWLLKLARKRKSWKPFTQNDIDELYQKKFPKEHFWFNKLTEDGDIVKIGNYYHFTDYFIIECNKLLNSCKLISGC